MGVSVASGSDQGHEEDNVIFVDLGGFGDRVMLDTRKCKCNSVGTLIKCGGHVDTIRHGN